MNLRPYQEQAVKHAVSMLTERGNSLIVAGTGAGKTIMMASAIGNFFRGFRSVNKRSPHVLVLVHRKEIHNQNRSKFELVNPDIATSEITASRKSVNGYVHFGMVQTVANIMPELTKSGSLFDLIVIDEAHHSAASTYEDIINANKKGNPDAALLGVTATPNRGDEMPLIHLFDNYYQITTKFLIDSHYLVRPTFIDLTPEFRLKSGATEKGHLSKNCRNDLEGEVIINQLCDKYLEVKEPGKSVIFAPSHDFCERVYNRLKALGRHPAYLRAGIDEETRDKELERFENTDDCEELINVDICTEGYDFPPLRNLVDFDTNGTHGQWVQKVGRVLRLAPNKISCSVIDFGGNVELYPDGIDSTVNLDGAIKKERGMQLAERDFYRQDREEHGTADIVGMSDEVYTPYHLPKGFESIGDKDLGIVFVACGKATDCIIVADNDEYVLYTGDKEAIGVELRGDFDSCIKEAMERLCNETFSECTQPISRMQIKLLAPEYPTTALSRYGANCCICWKAWRGDIVGAHRQD